MGEGVGFLLTSMDRVRGEGSQRWLRFRGHRSSLGQASSELVHDLRNPLTVVLGYVQILSEDLQKVRHNQTSSLEASTEYISLIERNIQRCRDIIEVWQDLGRNAKRVHQPLRPAALLHEVVEGQRTLANAHRATFELRLSDPDAQVLGDALQLSRAFQNIVVNALDALPEVGGCVRVSGHVEGEYYCVLVSDNGSGISEENQKRLFEAYFTTKSANKGTGLGLFITHRIVEDHKGQIAVKSQPGVGTEMRVSLPLWREPNCPS